MNTPTGESDPSANDYATPAFAVIGLSGRFPGANDADTLWANLRAGKESITFFSDDELLAAGETPERLRDPAYVKAAGRLDDIAGFDAAFFGMSPRDAAIFDPQHRVFLECAWEAFENAGYVGERFDGPVGVFAASGGAEYLMHNLLPNRQVMESVGAWLVRHTGNDQNFLGTRVSYELNLTGPSMSVQSACSSSLLAVHAACQSLSNGECDMALAGGSTIYPEQNRGYLYREGEILSPDGHCRPFDADSAGTVMASAVGCVLLRRLEDALRDGDQILAIVRGSAVNNDGSQKVGYLAPSVTGQARVVTEALAIAGIEPADVSYIEAHGTGTLIGDPIELTALSQAFAGSTDQTQFCALGSLKSNIGHAGEASGICGFIKTVLALKHHEIPPSLHFETPNPQIDFANSPFFVNTQLREWTVPAGKRRIAGVTSLGAGGTNVHVLVEEAPLREPAAPSRSTQLLVLSAKSSSALELATQNLAAHLREQPDAALADTAFTLLAGRKRYAHRRALVAQDRADAVTALEAPDQKRLITQHRKQDHAPSVFFMFPGGGAQYARMGADLYEHEPTYRQAFDEALSHLEPALRTEVAALAFADPLQVEAASAHLEAPSRALPALLATEYAIARLLSHWGIAPAAMIGHSAGEYMAACLAGVITLREAMRLVALRGRLFETLPEGGMLSVPLPADEVRAIVSELNVAFAAINAPSLCVLSGPVAAIAEAEAALRAHDIECTRVRINVAAHSPMVDPILAEFERFCRTVQFKSPQIPFVSNVTGAWITDAEATDPHYWVRHLRSTVRFADGVQQLVNLDLSEGVFCEVGPGRTLTSLVRQQPGKVAAALATLRHPREDDTDVAFLLGAVGRMWVAGVPLDEARFFAGQQRRRVSLPTYPFERQRFWIDPDPSTSKTDTSSMALRKSPEIADWFSTSSWGRSAPPSPAEASGPQTWLVLSDASRLAGSLITRLRNAGHAVIEVEAASSFASLGPLRYAVNPAKRADFESLAQDLRERDVVPQRVLHLWAHASHPRRGKLNLRRAWDPLQTYDADLARNYFSLTFVAQVFAGDSESLRMFCVSSHLQSVPGDTEVHPEKAVLLGPCKVIPREYPQVACVSIDVTLPARRADESLLASRLFRELEGSADDDEVALRGTERWVRRYDRVRLDSSGQKPWLREAGVYLVTGGLGGIGLHVAEHLARSARVKLVLIGRTPLPVDQECDGWLASHGPDDETSRRITAVRAIRALGAEVMTVAADVTDAGAMRAALVAVRARFGPVHGVFHAAGILKDELIALRSPVAESAVINTKMRSALILDALLANDELDLFVLFSSVSSILGLPGQVDYTAANAFLDAFAYARTLRRAGRTLSIDWNAWQDVGMLANRVRAERGKDVTPAPTVAMNLSHAQATVLSDDAQSTLFRTTFRRTDHWLVGEHVVRDGDALIPGTGFLELARAALEHHRQSGVVELRDVVFLAPFTVPAHGERSLYLRVQRDGEHEFTFYAESETEPLVVGRVDYLNAAPAAHGVDLDAIRKRCTTLGEIENGQLVQHFMDFGPRWGSLQRIDLGQHEALLSLELPDRFASDLDLYRLHPALLDLATGAAQALVPGFQARTTFLVPFSYDRILIHAPLPRCIFSHVRHRPAGANDSVVFDATLYDASGAELVTIDGFTMRRAASAFLAAPHTNNNGHVAAASRAKSRAETVTETALGEGMTPVEGLEALDRMLAVEFSPQVVACTVPLQPWLEQLAQEARGPLTRDAGGSTTAGAQAFARPSDAAVFAAPRNAIERELAALWSSLLGVPEVSVHDDFFELGGHSLLAVRLFTKIKKSFGAELTLDTLFRAPTIATCAERIAEELGLPVQLEDAVTTIAPTNQPTKTQWSPLVPIRRQGSGTPFFCVHGAMGNVLNFRDLAARLGDGSPFFGLQAQGVDGKLPPQTSIEDMAALYISAIREVQPQGPYLLGGYSGGGVIAFEMAQQLYQLGEKTALLALLDSFSPLVPQRKYTWLEKVTNVLRGGPTYLITKYADEREARAYRLRLAEIQRCVAAGAIVPLELRETQMLDSYMRTQAAYQPKVYPGRLTLFRAETPAPIYAHVDPLLGWTDFAADGVDVHVVPGGHHNFIIEPRVEHLAAALKKCLDRAAIQDRTLSQGFLAARLLENQLTGTA